MILLDTNVISEAMKFSPALHVIQWLNSQPKAEMYVSALTEAEVRFGIELLASGRRKIARLTAAEAMFTEDFSGRILPFDSAAAKAFAHMAVDRKAKGRPISHFDGQIASIALTRGAALATRNTQDFEGCGVKLINPWR